MKNLYRVDYSFINDQNEIKQYALFEGASNEEELQEILKKRLLDNVTIEKIQIHESFITLINFAPDKNNGMKHTDTSKVWAVLSCGDGDTAAYDYISNIFGINEFDETIGKPTFTVNVVSVVYKQHSNGGRTNNKDYPSIDAYVNDPITKKLYQQKLKSSFFDLSPGDPDSVDAIYTIEYNGQLFNLSGTHYDIIPPDWYSEEHQDTGKRLSKSVAYDTAEEALNSLGEPTNDLFGQRYFPVVKCDRANLSSVVNECENFKSCSKPIFFGNYAFIGIRSKTHEVNYIRDVYKAGGVVLKNEEWNW
jgi:hypothetical protein